MFVIPRSVSSTRVLLRAFGGRIYPRGQETMSQSSRNAIHTTSVSRTDKHTADSYFKDVDTTPPADSTVHRVDPDSDRVQKPYEAPSGEWSRTGVEAAHSRPATEKAPAKKGDAVGKESK